VHLQASNPTSGEAGGQTSGQGNTALSERVASKKSRPEARSILSYPSSAGSAPPRFSAASGQTCRDPSRANMIRHRKNDPPDVLEARWKMSWDQVSATAPRRDRPRHEAGRKRQRRIGCDGTGDALVALNDAGIVPAVGGGCLSVHGQDATACYGAVLVCNPTSMGARLAVATECGLRGRRPDRPYADSGSRSARGRGQGRAGGEHREEKSACSPMYFARAANSASVSICPLLTSSTAT